jgi:glycine cleavage system H protein
MRYPEEFKYSEQHTWVYIKDGVATIGITEYAAEELNNILAVDLPSEGDMIDQGESFGTLESSKTVSDIYAPISGEVIDVNTDALDDPAIISEYPHDDGWLLKISPTDEDNELESLLSNAKYEAFIDEESEGYDDDFDDFDDED